MLPSDQRVIPGCPAEFRSAVLGGEDYFTDAHRRASEAFFAASWEAVDEDGDLTRVAEGLLALVPQPDNDYNSQAVGVVYIPPHAQVSAANQIGFIPDRLCATTQPRLVTLTRVLGGAPLARATATYWPDERWHPDEGEFRIELGPWWQLHDYAIEQARRVEPDVEQPYVGHYTPLTDLAQQLYSDGGAEDAYGLVPVRYELAGDDLVATFGGEVLSDITSGGRDFSDSLRARVERDGPVRGWVRLHRGAVETLTESRPDRTPPV